MSKSLPTTMMHRAVPTSVSVNLGRSSADEVKDYSRGCPLVVKRVQFSHSVLTCQVADKKVVGPLLKSLV